MPVDEAAGVIHEVAPQSPPVPPEPPEPIAIVGIGCRLPGGVDGPESFWDLLMAGEDGLVDVPRDRWQVAKFYDPDLSAGTSRVRRGGFLRGPIDEFDAGFFEISPREADHIDPQQRLLLEVAWEAVENSGTPLELLAGTATGVFIGGFTLDYSQLQFAGADRTNVAAHTATGVVMTMLANRISHAFDLLGPSVALDTACSSSLVAVHLACRSLWSGESTVALAGGVNLMLTPNFTIAASQGGFLSPTSHSHPFDATADGYVRGEGAGIVVLKTLAAALAGGDRIYAVIRGTAVTQDGRTNGITVPNGTSQQRAMRDALTVAGVTASSVAYVEAHGTSTPVGDPIEANAIGEVYGRGADRPAGDACLLTSVKANIGHLEAAAGVTGLIKAALCVHHRQVPRHLHLTTVNPGLDLADLRLRIPTVVEPLQERDGAVRAAVNSFGFGGTNAHVVLECAPSSRATDPSTTDLFDNLPIAPLTSVFPLSARSAPALADLAGRYVEALQDTDHATLGSAVAHHRTHHRQARVAVVTDSPTELRDALDSVRSGQPHPAVRLSEGPAVGSPLAFVFTGMGPQWWGMGRELFGTNRTFRTAIERCDSELRRHADWSLMEELQAQETASRMTQTQISQPANFALQVALTEVWATLGVTPGAVIGHSAGEIAAAYVAGGLGFEDAVRVIYQRARLQHLTTGQGRLLSAAIAEDRARELPAVLDGRLAVAAINSPSSVALVGRICDLDEVKTILDGEDVFCRFVDGDVPFHSPLMDPLEPELRQCLASLAPVTPSTPLYSGVTGERVTGVVHDADYWWRNVREPVRFAGAAAAMIDDGVTAFVEVGPHPVLGRALADLLHAGGRHGFSVPSLKRDSPDGVTMAQACAELYVNGHSLDWNAFHRAGASHDLPSYPWQRERYWKETDANRRDRLGELDHSLIGTRRDVPTPTWRRHLDGSRPAYLADHRVMEANLFPGAGYVEMALAAGRAVFGSRRCVVEQVRFEAPTVLRPGPAYVLDTTLDRATGRVEIHGRQQGALKWTRHATARLAPAAVSMPRIDLDPIRARCVQEWDSTRCYEAFRSHGFDYGPSFRSIEELWLGDGEAIGRLSADVVARNAQEDLILDPIVLDGCFQMLLPLVGVLSDDAAMLMPVGVDRIVLHEHVDEALWVHATATGQSGHELTSDAVLVTESGRVVIEVHGFRVRVLAAGQRGPSRQGTSWLHEVIWEQQDGVPAEAAPTGEVAAGRWLVLADSAGVADAVAGLLVGRGHAVVVARAGDAFAAAGPDEFRIRPGERADLEAVVRDVAGRTDLPVSGVIHAWSAGARDGDLTSDRMSAVISESPLSLVHLVQTLDAEDLAWPLSVVTVGAQPVDGRIQAAGLLQTPVWGMSRVLHQESLSLRSRIMDLDPDRPLDDLPALVAELLRTDVSEDQVAWRGGERRVARLQPSGRESGSVPFTLDVDASYLITGGLGALGLLFARRLAQLGARRIILAESLALPPRSSWAALAAVDPQRARVDALIDVEKLGAVIETAALDVTDGPALRDFIKRRRVQGLPPVHGVIHAAGAVHDQIMTRMTQDQLDTVMRPKTLGGWALHEALADEPLDFFVLFSSVSSVVVTAGQGNYAAGNAFLDGLAYYRRGQGLPALSINWGPWDVGMIAQLELQPLYERRGIDLLSETAGIEIFEELLGSSQVQQLAMSAHWPTLIASYPIVPRLIEHLGHRSEDAAAESAGLETSITELLAAAPVEEHQQMITDACAQIIGNVLRMRPDQLQREEELNHLGLDSMIAVELRIRLEQAFGVAPKVVFLLHGATVTDIANVIHVELIARDTTVPESPAELAALLGEFDQDAVESLLADIELLVVKETEA
jgi:hybrid polyketide synthase/nonribosomal peptide synthetase FtdB